MNTREKTLWLRFFGSAYYMLRIFLFFQVVEPFKDLKLFGELPGKLKWLWISIGAHFGNHVLFISLFIYLFSETGI